MITAIGTQWPSDVMLQGWQEAGLIIASKIRFKIFTLDHALIIRRLGRLTERDANAVRDALGHVFAASG